MSAKAAAERAAVIPAIADCPKYGVPKSTVFCVMECDFKNRCRPFLGYYLKNQELVDRAVNEYKVTNDKARKEELISSTSFLVSAEPPAAKTDKPQEPARRSKSAPSQRSAQKAKTNTAKGKSPVAETGKGATEQTASVLQGQIEKTAGVSKVKKSVAEQTLGREAISSVAQKTVKEPKPMENKATHGADNQVYIILEQGGKAIVAESADRVLDHVLKNKKKARYFRATELEVKLQMVPMKSPPQPAKKGKPSARRKVSLPQAAKASKAAEAQPQAK